MAISKEGGLWSRERLAWQRDAQEKRRDKEISGGKSQALFLQPDPSNPWDLFPSFINQIKSHNSETYNQENAQVEEQ